MQVALLTGAFVIAAGALTAFLAAVDADLAAATLTLLGLIVVAAGLGPVPAVVTVTVAYVAVNIAFSPPTGRVTVTKVDDLVPFAVFALAATACSMSRERPDLRPLVAVIGTSIASAVLLAADADLVVAALVLLGVVVLTALLGAPAAVTAVCASYVALNYWFTVPVGSFEITKAADLAPLIAFIAAAAASAGTVARINWLRRRATLVEQREFEARVAQAASESRATFLASMTHNLRTPLATIRASVSAVLGPAGDDADQRTRLLRNARDETDRLDRLVTKVLQMTRIHAGASTPNLELVDLGELAGRVVHRMEHLATAQGIRVALSTEDLVFAPVDPDMLELVFVVMLENAVKFAPADSQIDVRVGNASSTTARVSVADHGPGVPEEQRERVFDEFVRLDPAGDGSGLGLTIARSMVEAHGGRMWLEQTPDGGATTVVELPTRGAPA